MQLIQEDFDMIEGQQLYHPRRALIISLPCAWATQPATATIDLFPVFSFLALILSLIRLTQNMFFQLLFHVYGMYSKL